jgi:peptidoglycan/LPS O-acetylase OafA/YrhL
MFTLGHLFETRPNNFNIVRLLAAFLVLAGHSYPLTGKPTKLAAALGHDPGSLGVATFFVISGFLITRSVENRKIREYATARFLRIVPALAAVVVLTVFVVGPIFTKFKLSQYFALSETFLYLTNAIPYQTRFTLPGLFKNLPIAGGVNGSLWTLPLEAACYVILPALAAVGLIRRKTALATTAFVAIGLLIGISLFGLSFGKGGPVLFGTTELFQLLYYGLFFLVGAVLWVHRDDVPMNGLVALMFLVILWLSGGTSYSLLAMYTALPYLVMYVALARPIAPKAVKRIGDLSYGTYLMAFPLQQSIISLLGKTIGPQTLTIIVTLVVLPLAWLSWHYIEQLVLRLKNREPRVGAALA